MQSNNNNNHNGLINNIHDEFESINITALEGLSLDNFKEQNLSQTGQAKELTQNEKFKETLKKIISQMKSGCKRSICINTFCKGNPNFKQPASDKESLENAINLLKEHYDNKKYEYWQIVCDNDFMKDMCPTLQKENLNEIRNYNFMVEFVNCPYAFCLSFLKDPSLIGKEDAFGQNKQTSQTMIVSKYVYNLNLDEELVEQFFQILNDIEEEERNQDIQEGVTTLTQMFEESLTKLKKLSRNFHKV